MTSQFAADNQHIADALAYGLTGDRARAGVELSKVCRKSARHMYAAWAALAEAAVLPSRATAGPADAFGLQVLSMHGQEASIDDVPPAPRLVMRFMAAQANRDNDATRALFLAALQGDPDVMADAMVVLLDAAVDGSRQQIAAHKARGQS